MRMENSGIRRSTRDFPPAHYLLRVESFSLLAKSTVEKYESCAFEAADHKWKLCLYPNGDKNNNGNGFISLYLVIDEIENLPLNWEVNVSFKLFVFDQIRDKYLTIEDADGSVKRFDWMKTKWGFAQLIPLELFKDASNGYIVDDCCMFGVEVFLMECSCQRECLSMMKTLKLEDNTMTFKLENFSELDDEELYYESPIHMIGELGWKLKVYPKGDARCEGKALSVYLGLVEAEDALHKKKVHAEYILRVKDQINNNHEEITEDAWFGETGDDEPQWGYSDFLALEHVHDASKGFLVGDCLILEAEITIISIVKTSL